MWDIDFIKHPLFLRLQDFLEKHKLVLPNQYPDLEKLNLWLNQLQPNLLNSNNKLVKFAKQGTSFVNFEDGYEQSIYLKGDVQTRHNNWHDFFNALIWMRFPEIKKLVNSLQYQDFFNQNKIGKVKQRTVIQNQLAHFDECGVIVLSKSKELLNLLKNHQWHELFWTKREEVQSYMRFEIFGHALYEKALKPYIGFTGKALLIYCDDFNNIDSKAVNHINQNLINIKDLLSPLPILGVPGWWPENNCENFYANTDYFRRGRHVINVVALP